MTDTPDATTIWNIILSTGLLIMGYFIRKRDDKVDQHDNAIEEQKTNHSALELKIAENYATKSTMLSLFSETNQANKDAISRVEKRIDETNSALGNQGQKIDKVVESIGVMQTNILRELSKKT